MDDPEVARLGPFERALASVESRLQGLGVERVRTKAQADRLAIYLGVNPDKWQSIASAPPDHCPGWLPYVYRTIRDGLSDWMRPPKSAIWAPNRPLALALSSAAIAASPLTPYVRLPTWEATVSHPGWHTGSRAIELLVLPSFTKDRLGGPALDRALCTTRLGGIPNDDLFGAKFRVLEDLGLRSPS